MSIKSHRFAWGADLKRLLVITAIWHVAFVMAVFITARSQIWPQTFDTNGIGISFAIDSRNYRVEATDLAQFIHELKVRDWIIYNASFHVKLYSLSFALFGKVVGFNILAAEPLNLIYYLSILAISYLLALIAFDRSVAVTATGFIGLWPSLLLHTTQMLRDTLFIPSMLLLVLAMLLTLVRRPSPRQAVLIAVAGSIAVLNLWLCRGDMRELIFMIVLVGSGICAFAQFKDRRFDVGKCIVIVWLLMATFWIPRLIPAYRQTNESLAAPVRKVTDPEAPRSNGASQKRLVANSKAETNAPFSQLALRIKLLRHRYVMNYPLAGSNIDTDVELNGTADVIRYLPRAMLIGLFAPFPNMWFTQGEQVGKTGRLLAGAEMLIMYLVFGLMAFALIHQWRRLSFWLLLSIVLTGCLALGCVVVNISTLYRMRYVFFILLIILGTKGFLLLLPIWTGSTVPLGEQYAQAS